ncbi:unnamed protein product, partial [Iphiclides podalirius]
MATVEACVITSIFFKHPYTTIYKRCKTKYTNHKGEESQTKRLKMKSVVIFVSLMILAIHVESARHRNAPKAHDISNDAATDPSEMTDDGSSWPHPDTIHNFEVPSSFANDLGPNNNAEQTDQPSSGKHHRRNKASKH